MKRKLMALMLAGIMVIQSAGISWATEFTDGVNEEYGDSSENGNEEAFSDEQTETEDLEDDSPEKDLTEESEVPAMASGDTSDENVKVSFDLNYRAKLWTEEISEKQEVLSEMMEYVDICFGNPKDAAKMLAFNDGENDFINEENMKKVIEKYKFEYLITTNRQSISASDNGWSSLVCNSERLYNSKKYNLHIVDRVGGGDTFESVI